MSNNCCGFHVVKCAKVISIVGFIFSLLTGGLFTAIVLFLVYYGLEHNKSKWLLPAVVLLAISIAFYTLVFILGIVGTVLIMNDKEKKQDVPIAGIFVFLGFLLLNNIFDICCFVVINRARKYIIASKKRSAATTTTAGYPQTSTTTTVTATQQSYDNASTTSYPTAPSYPSYPPQSYQQSGTAKYPAY